MLFLLLCSGTGWAQKAATGDSLKNKLDLVELKNGDRIHGDIQKISRTKLFFDGDKTGVVKISLDQIKELTGRTKIYRIELLNAQKLVGTIQPGPSSGTAKIQQTSQTQEIKLEDIVGLQSFEKKFWKTLTGNLQLGYSFTKSSNITRFNLSNQLIYIAAKWDLRENFSGIYTIGDGDGFERIDASLDGLYLLKKRYTLLNKLQYQRMLELGVLGRVIATSGINKRIIQKRHQELDLGSGISVQREINLNGQSRYGAELPFFIGYNLFEIKKPDIDIFTKAIFYYSLTVKDRYRVDYKLQATYEIINDFTIGLEFYFNYDSKPITSSASSSDYGTVFTLGYEF